MIVEEVVKKLQSLTPDQQRKVMELVDDLASQQPAVIRRSLKGSMSDLGVDLNEGDFRQIRTEMWRSFPRDAA
jgi:hypothetical protein